MYSVVGVFLLLYFCDCRKNPNIFHFTILTPWRKFPHAVYWTRIGLHIICDVTIHAPSSALKSDFQRSRGRSSLWATNVKTVVYFQTHQWSYTVKLKHSTAGTRTKNSFECSGTLIIIQKRSSCCGLAFSSPPQSLKKQNYATIEQTDDWRCLVDVLTGSISSVTILWLDSKEDFVPGQNREANTGHDATMSPRVRGHKKNN